MAFSPAHPLELFAMTSDGHVRGIELQPKFLHDQVPHKPLRAKRTVMASSSSSLSSNSGPTAGKDDDGELVKEIQTLVYIYIYIY